MDDIVNMTMANRRFKKPMPMKNTLTTKSPTAKINMTICSKKHHLEPYENPDGDAEDFITRQRVEADLAVLVDNLMTFTHL